MMNQRTKVVLLARNSTDKQDSSYQVKCLLDICDANNYDVVQIFQTQISGKYGMKDRTDLTEILELGRKGLISKVLCTELSRVGRSFSSIHNFIDGLSDCKVSLYIHNYRVETLNPDKTINNLTTCLLGALSTASVMERQWCISRIKLGLENAKKNKGIVLGRPLNSIKSDDNFIRQYPKIFELLSKGFSIRQVQRLCGKYSTTTICKASKILKSNSQILKEVA